MTSCHSDKQWSGCQFAHFSNWGLERRKVFGRLIVQLPRFTAGWNSPPQVQPLLCQRPSLTTEYEVMIHATHSSFMYKKTKYFDE